MAYTYTAVAMFLTIDTHGFKPIYQQVAEGIKDDDTKTKSLLDVVTEMSDAGSISRDGVIFDRALKTAEGIKDARTKIEALLHLSSAIAGAGNCEKAATLFERAHHAVDSISDGEFSGPESLGEVMDAMTSAGVVCNDRGLIDHAQTIAERSGFGKVTTQSAVALQGVSSALLKLGEKNKDFSLLEEALKVTTEIDYEFDDEHREVEERSSALEDIALAMARIGVTNKDNALVDRAHKLVEGIVSPNARAGALRGLASLMAESGKLSSAAELLEQAQQATLEILKPDERFAGMRANAGELAAIGRIRSARSIASQEPDVEERALTLATILERASAHP